MNIRVGEKLRDWIEEESAAAGISMSSFIERILAKEMINRVCQISDKQ